MKKQKKILKTRNILLTLCGLYITACQQEVFKMPPLKNPENLSVTVKIKGTSESQPNGDGSGEVTFTAKADNAITYQFLSGSEEQLFPSGTLTHTFYEVGTKEYNIQILAKGAGGATVGTTKKIKVRVDYTPPADLLQILHGDNQRVWRIKNEVAGHLGVGPADKKNPIWWSANPNDKQNKGVYDDRITFKKDGSFTYQTNGSAFGKKGAMDTDFPSIAALGLAGNSGDYENVPLAAFGGRWVLTAPQGQETLTLSNKGYLGMYVGGNHNYAIQKRETSEIAVRTIGADDNAWYMILTPER